MSYEKKYKEAMEDASYWIKEKPEYKELLQSLFPELTESEDEQAMRIIRKRMCYDPVPISDEDRRIVEAWLEKQKEHQNNSDAPEKALGRDLTFPQDKDKNLDDIAQEYVEGVKEYNPTPDWNLIHTAVCYGYHLADQEEQKPVEWTELTWKDIVELEGIINNVHYEFRNGIGQESFGKEVLEKFREYKGDDYLDEQEQEPRLIGEDSVEKKARQMYETGQTIEEQKPAEWSEKDEVYLNIIVEDLKELYKKRKAAPDSILGKSQMDNISWLKSLPERFNLQPKQEWSEEDRKNIERLIEILPKCIFRHPSILERDECRDLGVWLRNLLYYPQKLEGWKPSEEQMSMLLAVIRDPNNAGSESCFLALQSLYEQLKKL